MSTQASYSAIYNINQSNDFNLNKIVNNNNNKKKTKDNNNFNNENNNNINNSDKIDNNEKLMLEQINKLKLLTKNELSPRSNPSSTTNNATNTTNNINKLKQYFHKHIENKSNNNPTNNNGNYINQEKSEKTTTTTSISNSTHNNNNNNNNNNENKESDYMLHIDSSARIKRNQSAQLKAKKPIRAKSKVETGSNYITNQASPGINRTFTIKKTSPTNINLKIKDDTLNSKVSKSLYVNEFAFLSNNYPNEIIKADESNETIKNGTSRLSSNDLVTKSLNVNSNKTIESSIYKDDTKRYQNDLNSKLILNKQNSNRSEASSQNGASKITSYSSPNHQNNNNSDINSNRAKTNNGRLKENNSPNNSTSPNPTPESKKPNIKSISRPNSKLEKPARNNKQTDDNSYASSASASSSLVGNKKQIPIKNAKKNNVYAKLGTADNLKSNSTLSTPSNDLNDESSSKIVDQMASFIDELKDFIDDKLIDTTSQLEVANQRINGLYEFFDFIAGEFEYLKFQNQELKNELFSYNQILYHKLHNFTNTNRNNSQNSSTSKPRRAKIRNNYSNYAHMPNSETGTSIGEFPTLINQKIKTSTRNKINHSEESSSNSVYSDLSQEHLAETNQNRKNKNKHTYQNFNQNYSNHHSQHSPDKPTRNRIVINLKDIKKSLGDKLIDEELYARIYNNGFRITSNRNEDAPTTYAPQSKLYDAKTIKKDSSSSINFYDNMFEQPKYEMNWSVNSSEQKPYRNSSQVDVNSNVMVQTQFVSTELQTDENDKSENCYYGENSNLVNEHEIGSSEENFEGDEDYIEEHGMYDNDEKDEDANGDVNMNHREKTGRLDLNGVRVNNTNRAKKSPDANLIQNLHTITSIVPPYSNLMNDFDNQYLWDYSDDSNILNKFEK